MAISVIQRLNAKREGLHTYLPAAVVCVCGALSALFIMTIPVLIRLLASTVAFCDRFILYRSLNFARLAFSQNKVLIGEYMQLLWPFIVASVVLGALLAWLRRTRGLYYRSIPWRPYERRIRLPAPIHQLITIVAGPLMLYAMAWYVNSYIYMPILVANFAFWLASGAAALVVWEALSDVLVMIGIGLRLWKRPHRRLDVELELKWLIERDNTLSGVVCHDVIVNADGTAKIVVDLSPKQKPRVEEMVANIPFIRSLTLVSAHE